MNGIFNTGDIVLGNWTLVQIIGNGSFGKVFEAEREDFGTVYKAAIKIITIPQNHAEVKRARAEGMDEGSVTAYFKSVVEEIVGEIVLMSRLKGTTNVVGYEDHTVIQHTEGVGWDIIIRMELLTSLMDHAEKRPYTRKDVIKLGIDMCKALELCQRYNIIHRDIKPENIFISDIGDYKLGDFGIARTVERTTEALSRKGTFTYMAPEIYRDGTYGSSVDICSLGIVLYQLLNYNRTPFLPGYPAPITHNERESALAKRVAGAKMPVPCNANGRLAEIVLKACAYDPTDRYSSPMQMRSELEAIHYSREEAQIIYPMGDETPVMPDEYAKSTSNRPDPIRREKTTLIRDYGDDVEPTEDILDAVSVALDEKIKSIDDWQVDRPLISCVEPIRALEQKEIEPVQVTQEQAKHKGFFAKKIVSLFLAALLAVVVGFVGIYSMVQLWENTNVHILPSVDTARFFQIPYRLQTCMYDIIIAPLSEENGRDYSEYQRDISEYYQVWTGISEEFSYYKLWLEGFEVGIQEQDMLDEIHDYLRNDISPLKDSIIEYSLSGDTEDALSQMTDTAPVRNQLDVCFEALMEMNAETIRTNKDISANLFNTYWTILIAISFIACGTVVFLKIKYFKKEAVSFLLVTIMIIGIGGTSIYGITMINEYHSSLYGNQILPGLDTVNITAKLQLERRLMRQLLIAAYTDDYNMINNAYSGSITTRAAINELIDTFSNMVADQQERDLVTDAQYWYQNTSRNLDVLYEGAKEGDIQELYGVAEAYDAEINSVISCFEELLSIKVEETADIVDQIFKKSEIINISVLIMIVMAVVTAAVSTAINIKRRRYPNDKTLQHR